MTHLRPDLNWNLEQLFQCYPAVIKVLIRLRMACPGCPVARFVNIAEAAECYSIAPEKFLKEILPACR